MEIKTLGKSVVENSKRQSLEHGVSIEPTTTVWQSIVESAKLSHEEE